MFGGVADVPFTCDGSVISLRTNSTFEGVAAYEASYTNHPLNVEKVVIAPYTKTENFNSAGKVKSYNFEYVEGGWSSDPISKVPNTENAAGIADLYISFKDKPMAVTVTYADGQTKTNFYNTYDIDLFKPTATITDTELKGDKQTDRSYRGEFDITGANSFKMSNLGGHFASNNVSVQRKFVGWDAYIDEDGFRVPLRTYANQFVSSPENFSGSFDLQVGTATLNSANYTIRPSGSD